MDSINKILANACKKGDKKLVLSAIEQGAQEKQELDWDEGLIGACRGGHKEIVELMIEKGAKDRWDDGFMEACENGHKEIVELMLKSTSLYASEATAMEPKHNWNRGMRNACENGHIDIVKIMIENGTNEWDEGLSYACHGGYKDIAELIIEKRDDNEKFLWDYALVDAYRGRNMELVLLMIMNGADINNNDVHLPDSLIYYLVQERILHSVSKYNNIRDSFKESQKMLPVILDDILIHDLISMILLF